MNDKGGCGPFTPLVGAAESLRLSIFERIRAEGTVARATIAKDLSISPATVTTQTSSLIELGFIRESPIADSVETNRGRPPIGLSVEPEAHLVAGLKLSDNEHSAVIYDFAGNQIASASAPALPEKDTGSVVKATQTLVQSICDQVGLTVDDLSAIGVGVPGFIDRSRGIVHWSPLLTERTLDFSSRLEDRLGRDVIVDNDANLIALAELWFGVGRQISNFAVVTIEHGAGMGLVINHKLYAGARGIGLELGHTKVALDGALCRCGQRGCLEAYVADYALVREAAFASSAVKPGAPTREVLETLYRDAKAGNASARSIFERAGKYLAMGIGNVMNLFDPELIILSGGRMQYDYLYSDDIMKEIQHHALNSGVDLPPIEVHAWGDLVWASGAAALALSHVTESQLLE
ncbi:MAG: ROK family protein [Pseudomonadota bacterium]